MVASFTLTFPNCQKVRIRARMVIAASNVTTVVRTVDEALLERFGQHEECARLHIPLSLAVFDNLMHARDHRAGRSGVAPAHHAVVVFANVDERRCLRWE